MVIDPGSLGALGQGLAKGIRSFERELSDDPWPRRDLGDEPPLSSTAVRIAGLVVIAIGLLAVVVD